MHDLNVNKYIYLVCQIEDAGYEWFDFHRECRGMKWENISKLIAKIVPEIDSFEYFMAEIGTSNVIQPTTKFTLISLKNLILQT